ncbi:MFS transporter [Salinicola rhizosphaerae]|uniref:MFS transporter n=1 Tax=Salinicola rhizosphaerae TaxID=1443141 RepID=A0ABQ3E3K5_9GAMM|nr:MFS transporter [Salinicola rhizosphaerae]GHB23842.1 MFS transporter [Salinicola rhizosphaerae]
MPPTPSPEPDRRPLSRGDVKVLSLSALGGALEFYDFIIFVYFATVIGQLFFPPEMPEWLRQIQTFGIFAAGYLVRPLGGVLMAHFGDLLGRKRMFTLSILLMALPTLAIGCLPTYADIGYLAPLVLVCLRMLQGAAVGGEVPGAWVFVSEHVPRRHVGLACGTLSAGLAAGILIGSLVSAAMKAHFSTPALAEGAWRIPFLIGGAFGLIAVYLRRWLHETPVFAELRERRALAAELPVKTVLRDHLGGVLVAGAVSWILTAAIIVVMLMTPPLLAAQYSGLDASLANVVAILCLIVGCVLAGWCADRFGSGATLIGWSALLGVSYWLMMSVVGTHPQQLMPLYALAGFAVGITGAIPVIAVKAFPPAVRFSGLSFSYNVAYALFGGFTPIIVTTLMRWYPMSPAIYVGALAVMGMLLGLYLLYSMAGRRLAVMSQF